MTRDPAYGSALLNQRMQWTVDVCKAVSINTSSPLIFIFMLMNRPFVAFDCWNHHRFLVDEPHVGNDGPVRVYVGPMCQSWNRMRKYNYKWRSRRTVDCCVSRWGRAWAFLDLPASYNRVDWATCSLEPVEEVMKFRVDLNSHFQHTWHA